MKNLFQYLGILLLLAAVSCDKNEKEDVKVTRISLSETEIILRKGDVRSLSVTLAPSSATDQTVIWTSSNSNVVSVRDGLITAVEVGGANVYVTTADGRKRAGCAVTVVPEYIPVESVMIMDEDGANSLNGGVLRMVEGDTYVAIAAVRPGDATNPNVSWMTSDPLVATVKNGTIKAVSAGSCTLTITSDAGDKTASCTVSVQEYVPPINVTDVTLDQTSLTMTELGQTVKLIATVLPEDAETRDVRWSSSHPEVASVADDGNVTALAFGMAIITVTTQDGGYTASCTIFIVESTGEVDGGYEEFDENPFPW